MVQHLHSRFHGVWVDPVITAYKSALQGSQENQEAITIAEASLTKLLLALSLTALAVLLVGEIYSVIFLVGGVIVACIAHLFLLGLRSGASPPISASSKSKHRQPSRSLEEEEHEGVDSASGRRTTRLFIALFIVSTSLAIWVAWLNVSTRPISYYGLIALAGIALGFQIQQATHPKSVYVVLGQIVAFSALLSGSIQLTFPSGIGGADSYFHATFLVSPIIESGAIPAGAPLGYVYEFFPNHGLLVAIGSILLGLPAEATYYHFGFLVMLVPVLAAFVVGKELLGNRTGLWAALLLGAAGYFIFWASHASALTFAVAITSVIFIGLVKAFRRPRASYVIVLAIGFLSLVFTHAYTSMVLGIILFALAISHLLGTSGSTMVRTSGRLATLFGLILLAHWMFYSPFFREAVTLFNSYYLAIVEQEVVFIVTVYDTIPLNVIFLNTLGESILVSLATLGLLVSVTQVKGPTLRLVISATIVLLLLGGIGLVTNLAYILPNRLWVFLTFFGLSPLGAMALTKCTALRPSYSFPSHRLLARQAVAAGLVGTFVFFSTASTVAGFETSPLSFNQPYVKYWNTQQEDVAVAWFCKFSLEGGQTTASRSLSFLARSQLLECVSSSMQSLGSIPLTDAGSVDVDSIQPESYVVFSWFDVWAGFQTGVIGRGKHGTTIFHQLGDDDVTRLATYSHVYDNGIVAIFLA